jgi:hypothetical protein
MKDLNFNILFSLNNQNCDYSSVESKRMNDSSPHSFIELKKSRNIQRKLIELTIIKFKVNKVS